MSQSNTNIPYTNDQYSHFENDTDSLRDSRAGSPNSFILDINRDVDKTSIAKKGPGRPSALVWNYMTKSKEKAAGKYAAACNFCSTKWSWANPMDLEIHLANNCINVPSNVCKFILLKIFIN